jgi:hypothetical protein
LLDKYAKDLAIADLIVLMWVLIHLIKKLTNA